MEAVEKMLSPCNWLTRAGRGFGAPRPRGQAMFGLTETDRCMVGTTESLFRHCAVGLHGACKENLHALWLKWSRSALGAGGTVAGERPDYYFIAIPPG